MKPVYTLLSKVESIPYFRYRGHALRLSSQIPAFADEVNVLQKVNNIISVRTVTTFYDSKGDIIERSFDFSGKPYRNRLYSKYENKIGKDEFVTSTSIREYSLPRSRSDLYKQFDKDPQMVHIPRYAIWDNIKNVTNHVSKNIKNGITILSQTSVSDISKISRVLHTFKEFAPIVNNKLQNTKPKVLKFRVNEHKYEVLPETIVSEGVKFPKNDSFIAYRALDINSAKEPLTDRFINKRGLKSLKINVVPEYIPKEDEKGVAAVFYGDDGSVRFNGEYKFPSKIKLVGTASHEAEHGWHYFLYYRNNGETNLWTIRNPRKFKKIKSKALKREAARYAKSIDNYTSIDTDIKLYRKNYIEVCAGKAALRAEKDYIKEGKTLHKDFPHIPPELI